MSGQLYAPAALPPVPTEYETGWWEKCSFNDEARGYIWFKCKGASYDEFSGHTNDLTTGGILFLSLPPTSPPLLKDNHFSATHVTEVCDTL
jgi:hypothetical protein